ncbi:MAG: mechanosensitive ion channel [Rikenellaceae bacterium]|nr:mechanosensitive ion channel [Rikenellaceae bacterium]
MFFLQTDLIAADSVATAKVTQTVEQIKSMPFEDALEFVTKGLLDFGWDILIAVAIYIVGRWIVRYLDRLLERIFIRREMEVSLAKFIRSFVRTALYVIIIITIVRKLGIDTSSFVALLASTGVAIGMALSGTLQNFAGGIMILLLRPFRIGDYVQTQGVEGSIKEIKLFNTVINTVDNKLITLPNGPIVNNIINNFSAENRRRVDLKVSISYGDDYDVARQALLDMIAADERIEKDPAPFVAIGSLGENAVNITIRVWAKSSDYWGIYHDLNEKIYKELPAKGIHFPFPQIQVHVDK